MSLTLYGISNCDTVRKARKALEATGTDFRFHDFRRDGIDEALASSMIEAVGVDHLLNRRGTTWRALSDDEKARADGPGLARLLAEHPALIKRPVWKKDGDYKVGFAAKEMDERLAWANA